MKKLIKALACAAVACGIAVAAVACGASTSINVYNRESGSGTRDAFLELLEIEDTQLVSAGAGLSSTGAVLNAVMDDPNGIGYVSLGSLDDTVKVVSVDGVAPTVENVQNDSYAVARPFEMMYQADESNDLLNDFVKFLQSKQAQQIISDYGYVSVAPSAPEYVKPASLNTKKLTIGGSTSVQPLMSIDSDATPCLITAYKQACGVAGVEITYAGTGSGTGITSAADGSYDIGFASKEVSNETANAGATAPVSVYQLCADGIAIIVNTENEVTDLTKAQLKDIYTGKITDWTAITGATASV